VYNSNETVEYFLSLDIRLPHLCYLGKLRLLLVLGCGWSEFLHFAEPKS